MRPRTPGTPDFANLAGQLPSRSRRHQQPRPCRLALLGPGSVSAPGLGATPAPLAPDQAHRASEAGQIAQLDGHPVVGLGAASAAPAEHDLSGQRLHHHAELSSYLIHREHAKPLETKQRLGESDIVRHRRGFPSLEFRGVGAGRLMLAHRALRLNGSYTRSAGTRECFTRSDVCAMSQKACSGCLPGQPSFDQIRSAVCWVSGHRCQCVGRTRPPPTVLPRLLLRRPLGGADRSIVP